MKKLHIIAAGSILGMTSPFVDAANYNQSGQSAPVPPEKTAAWNMLERALPALERLKNQNGQAFDRKQLEGENILEYTGFPDCPTICPKSFENYLTALRSIRETDPHALENLTLLFTASRTSYEGKPYTPETMKEWVKNFELEFIGTGLQVIALIGNDADMEPVWTAMRTRTPGGGHRTRGILFRPADEDSNGIGKYRGLVQTQKAAEEVESPLRSMLGIELKPTNLQSNPALQPKTP